MSQRIVSCFGRFDDAEHLLEREDDLEGAVRKTQVGRIRELERDFRAEGRGLLAGDFKQALAEVDAAQAGEALPVKLEEQPAGASPHVENPALLRRRKNVPAQKDFLFA